jgi:Flp pilus assembly protein TadB
MSIILEITMLRKMKNCCKASSIEERGRGKKKIQRISQQERREATIVASLPLFHLARVLPGGHF